MSNVSPSADVVTAAQVELNNLGFGPLRVNGVVDANTEAAVTKFQQSKGLGTRSWMWEQSANGFDDLGFLTKGTLDAIADATKAAGAAVVRDELKPGDRDMEYLRTTTPAPALVAPTPFYKDPKFLIGGVVLGAAVLWYLEYRKKDEKSGKMAGHTEEEDVKPTKKCTRTPDFESAVTVTEIE